MRAVFIAMWLLCVCSWSQAEGRAAAAIEGQLEQGRQHSAVLTVSPESGDLVGYVFADESAVGRAVRQACQVGKPCALMDAHLMDIAAAQGDELGFTDNPSAWIAVVRAGAMRSLP